MRMYKEIVVNGNMRAMMEPIEHPSAVTIFPYEGAHDLAPSHSVVAKGYTGCIQLRTKTVGGHFGAFEEPGCICEDLRDFVRKLNLI